MKIQELIRTILASSPQLGTFSLSELLRFASSKGINGIAVAVDGDREFDLAFLGGNPEGAILVEEKGTLYGDKAVMLLAGNKSFSLYEVKPDLVEAVAMGCRILEKSHLRKKDSIPMPEIGRRSDGLGVLTITVIRDNEPQNGVRVSIRKDSQVICSDVTTEDGSVGFKLLHGKYDSIIQDRASKITLFHIRFDNEHVHQTLEI
jgi:hypothetical protein